MLAEKRIEYYCGPKVIADLKKACKDMRGDPAAVCRAIDRFLPAAKQTGEVTVKKTVGKP